MTPERDPDLDALLGAYALDALDAAERERVESYVAGNADARAEVDELRETAASLALAPVDETDAPPALWDRIAYEIAGEPEGVAQPARRQRARLRARGRQRWLVPVAAAAAIAIVLGVVVTTRDNTDPTDVAAAFDDALDDGARELALAGRDGQVARIAILDDGTGYLRNEALAPLRAGEVYQLWALVGDAGEPSVISAGVLGPDPDAAAFTVAGSVHGFVLTVEQAPGVATSSQDPVAATV